MRKSLLGLFCFIFTLNQISAQELLPTKGTQFWFGYMTNYVDQASDSLYVFISSNKTTTGTLSVPLAGYSQDFTVTANVTTELIVPNEFESNFSETIEQKGILIETDDTVSVFAINFDSYTADGTKVLPIQSIGDEYRVMAYNGYGGTFDIDSEFLIVASEDNTEVEITPTVATEGGKPAGQPFIVRLNQGETYQVRAASSAADLTGTTIKSTPQSGPCKAFAVFSGASCTKVPNQCTACDHIYDQNFPLDTWGFNYFVVPFTATTGYTYRVMADQDNTSFSVNGGAPITLNAGQVYERNFVTNDIYVSANKPINVTQFIEGITCSGAGDPAMLTLNDETQRIIDVTFATMNSDIITQHNVNLIIPTADIGQITLDGTAIASTAFTPFIGNPLFAWAQVSITEGSHHLELESGFTAYVYGTGTAESYAYSVGSFTSVEPPLSDTIYCTLDTVTLTNVLNLDEPWWTLLSNPNDTLSEGDTLKVLPTLSETYVLNGFSLPSGCHTQFYFVVETPTPPNINLSSSLDTICRFQEVTLTASLNPTSSLYKYDWSPQVYLTNNGSANVKALPPRSMWFYCNVYTNSGCVDITDSVFIYVKDSGDLVTIALEEKLLACLDDTVMLNPQLEKQIFTDYFDTGVSSVLWNSITGGEPSTACGASFGDALYFNGTGSRQAITNDMNLSTGGTVYFAIKIANGSAPCEDADFGEDVVLEYSTNSGGNWNIIKTYFEAIYPDFQSVAAEIPTAAQTASTRLRWRQLANSGIDQDNWAIDEVIIAVKDSTGFLFSWTPNTYLLADTLLNVKSVPTNDIGYTISIVDSSTGCIYGDSVYVDVGFPFTLNTTGDTLMCYTNGVQLKTTPTSGEGHSYNWQPDYFLNNHKLPAPIASPDSTIQYSVVVTSIHGCSDTDSVYVEFVRKSTLFTIPEIDTICQGDTIMLESFLINNCGLNNSTCDHTEDTLAIFDSIIRSQVVFRRGVKSIKHQYLIESDKLIAAGLSPTEAISGIEFFVDSISGDSVLKNFHIGLGCTQDDEYEGFFSVEFMSTTEVYYNDSTTMKKGWNSLDFLEVYDWNGSDNIIVEICYFNDDTLSEMYLAGENSFFGGGLKAVSNSSDTISVCEGINGSIAVFRPWTRIKHCTRVDTNIIYSWIPGSEVSDSSQSTTFAYPSKPTNYTISHFDTVTLCRYVASIPVKVDSLTEPSFVISDTFVCDGASIRLFASGGNTYQWSPGGTLTDTNIPNPFASPLVNTNYEVIITNFCKSDTLNVDVDIAPIPNIGLPSDTLLCKFDTIQVSAQIDNGSSIRWSPTTGLSNPNIPNPFISLDEPFTYNILVTDTLTGCYALGDLSIGIDEGVNGIIITNDTTICIGQSLMLEAQGAISYQWFPSDSLSDSSSSTPIASPTDTTLYKVAFYSLVCPVDSAEVIVNVNNPSVFAFEDTTICIGGTAQLNAIGGTNYQWMPNTDIDDPNQAFTNAYPTTTTTYTVMGTDSVGCADSDSVIITVIANPDNPDPIFFQDTSIILGSSIVIQGVQSGYLYSWMPDETLSCNDCPNPIANPTTETTYTVIISDPSGLCNITDSITIIPKEQFLAIPSIFSPNGDGDNDLFSLIQLGISDLEYFRIFDRWGKLVFETTNSNQGWDGTYNGVDQEIGVYNYQLKVVFVDQNTTLPAEYNGNITLTR